jgi:hypothetical protein
MLKERMPNAAQLCLADNIHDPMSAGTAKTLTDYIISGKPSVIMVQGTPVSTEFFSKVRPIDFASGAQQGALIPSGIIVNLYQR